MKPKSIKTKSTKPETIKPEPETETPEPKLADWQKILIIRQNMDHWRTAHNHL